MSSECHSRRTIVMAEGTNAIVKQDKLDPTIARPRATCLSISMDSSVTCIRQHAVFTSKDLALELCASVDQGDSGSDPSMVVDRAKGLQLSVMPMSHVCT